MANFYTADLHIGHRLIQRLRGYSSLDSMHNTMIKAWNTYVKPEDTTYILGDLSFASRDVTAAVLAQMHGRKVLIRGNHDGHSAHWYRVAGIDSLLSGYAPRPTLLMHPVLAARPVLVSHYQYRPSWLRAVYYALTGQTKLLRYYHKLPERTDLPLIHGHVHLAWRHKANQLNVGWCVWGHPVSETNIVDILHLEPW